MSVLGFVVTVRCLVFLQINYSDEELKKFAQKVAKMASKSPKSSVDHTISGEITLTSKYSTIMCKFEHVNNFCVYIHVHVCMGKCSLYVRVHTVLVYILCLYVYILCWCTYCVGVHTVFVRVHTVFVCVHTVFVRVHTVFVRVHTVLVRVHTVFVRVHTVFVRVHTVFVRVHTVLVYILCLYVQGWLVVRAWAKE